MSRTKRLPAAHLLLLAGLCHFSSPRAHADHVAPLAPTDRVTEYEANLRAFLKQGRFNYFGELKGRWEDSNQQFRYRSLTLGPYYRAYKNLKVGAFYRVQQGARHDDDWIRPSPAAQPAFWKWRDTRKRTEHVLILDGTPRLQLDFLPGENWVAEAKTRYLFNTFNSQHTLTFRPGLTYFWLRGLDPFLNFYLQYELYIPLNYGVSTFYEKWLYAGALYHFSKRTQVGFFGALRDITWGTSQAWKDGWPGENYEVEFQSLVLGLILEFQFG